MAGILSNSASVTMVSGDSAVDKQIAGFLAAEEIALSTSPAGSSWLWGLAKPSGSTARAALSDTTAAAPTFKPDVAGYYTVTCTVDGSTSYVIRISVTQVAQTTSLEAIRLSPKADAEIATPALGAALYWSSDQDALAIKDSAGDVYTVDVTVVP